MYWPAERILASEEGLCGVSYIICRPTVFCHITVSYIACSVKCFDIFSALPGFATTSVLDYPYETLSYANGPGFYTHRASDSSNCSEGLWRVVPEEERKQAT
jgi:hypothetical protein